MAREINKLSAAKVNAITKRGLYADGHGLYLQVAKGGSKSWAFRYMFRGERHKLGLGPVHLVSLSEARQQALDLQRELFNGVDPLQKRKREQAEREAAEAKTMSFREAAEAYIAAHRPGWKNVKHAQQWQNTLATYCYPVFGNMPVSDIDTPHVMKALDRIWAKKPETASRVRSRVENVLSWATSAGYRAGENPARWNGHLKNLLPAKTKVAKVRHHPALPYADIGPFMAELRDMEGVSPRALEFLILTATRTNEVLEARWDEIDMEERLWVIPADRMKAGREHRVPLSDRAMEILRGLPREKGNDHIFIGNSNGGLSNMALAMVLRRMNREGVTVHGFRSSFSDWAAERTSYASEVREMALAHAVGNKVEAAYRRGDLFEKRRRIMDDWADHCAKTAPAGDNVIGIREAAQ